ncbi:MAG: RNA polymerase subunit sigma [Planctomycetota bacterium]|nr:MAG: RNA polymerase subunit sigma [Planctomycetota bacterium]REK23210.1 MAG: RNA polymerase subunit sigma [Planctomycetota bacterium]REK30871.1 MAG: RNA polymerase subunit sigma [Planctomycetota bacterium]
MAETDPALVEQVKAGSRDALAEFIAQSERQLTAYIERMMSDSLRRKVEPGDILQEVTVSALSALDSVDLTRQNPFGWLCQQAERRIIDAHRHHFGAQKRSASREVPLQARSGADDPGGGIADLLAASLTTPSAAVSRQQKEFHMLEALSALPEESREALRMRYMEHLPSKEIAQRLGKTDGAVRVMVTRSLQKLQDILAQNSDFQTLVAQQRKKEA